MQFAYLLILTFTLSYPLFKSFEDRVRFYKKWPALFPAIVIAAAIFIAWDVWFTKIDVWSFNHDYVLGIFILGLPLEEWLFFFITPFSCVFIHEVLIYFIKKDVLKNAVKYINVILAAGLLITAFIYRDRIYTLIDLSALGLFLLIHQFVLNSAYLGRFYITWSVCIIPFLLVNGFITGLPIVTYNKLNMMNIRIYTIPLEDLFYGMLNILLVITIYEYLKRKKNV